MSSVLARFEYRSCKVILMFLLVLTSTYGIVFAIAFGHGSYSRVQVDFNSSKEATSKLNLTKLYEAYASLIDLNQDNASSHYTFSHCMENYIHISPGVVTAYDKVYAGTYLLSFIVVFVLYSLILRSIHKHRAQLSKWKRSIHRPSEIATVERQLNAVTHVDLHNNNRKSNNLDKGKATDGEDGCLPEVQQPQANSNRRAIPTHQNALIADIRTSMRLFVVTIVFLVPFFQPG